MSTISRFHLGQSAVCRALFEAIDYSHSLSRLLLLKLCIAFIAFEMVFIGMALESLPDFDS
jgi:hypothetical protein